MAAAEKDVVELDDNTSKTRDRAVVSAIAKAKAKNARLRLMKERNENYLAEQKEEPDEDDEFRIKKKIV